MAKSGDTEDKLKYLREHVAYEREMLEFTYARLHKTEPGKEWNMAYESFAVHARNLYDFLRNEGKRQTNFRADDYVEGWGLSAFTLFNDLDIFVFHMAASREEREKLNLQILRKLGAWLDQQWAVWVGRLPQEYNGILSSNAVCDPALKLEAGVTLATACTVSTSTTVTFAPTKMPPTTYKY
jgi:hypothetical protein